MVENNNNDGLVYPLPDSTEAVIQRTIEGIQRLIKIHNSPQGDEEEEKTDVNNQMIQCPNCKASMTVDALGEHVNANPQTKQQAIEEQLQLWGHVYDRNYLIQNTVFCPACGKISHFGDWANDN